MKQDEFIQLSRQLVSELSSATIGELRTIAEENPTFDENEAADRLENEALQVVVSATKHWMRLRLGRLVAQLERSKVQS